jgi:hypothetical protein
MERGSATDAEVGTRMTSYSFLPSKEPEMGSTVQGWTLGRVAGSLLQRGA